MSRKSREVGAERLDGLETVHKHRFRASHHPRASMLKTSNPGQSAIARVTTMRRSDDTILRLGGDGAGHYMTWAADDRQYATILDGSGWPEFARHHCTRLFAISGTPHNATFQSVPDYPDINMFDLLVDTGAAFYGSGALAVEGHIYQFLATYDQPLLIADKATWAGLHYNGAKLIFSPDNGRTWCNQDGSTPVRRESRCDLSRETLVFFKEPQNAFTLLTFLQMGKGYQENRDGYVYVYSPNGIADGAVNELVMFRVPRTKVRERAAYEFFAGVRGDGEARWTMDINERRVVHTFPRGWGCQPGLARGWAWLPSVVYNQALGIYMMANGACGVAEGEAPDFCAVEQGTKPSYLGFWIASAPWGPWIQVYEETAWMPAGDPAVRADAPHIAPKWIANDGKSFWLTWWDGQPTRGLKSNIEEGFVRAVQSGDRDEFQRLRFQWRQYHPYFALNAERVDLVIK